MKKFIISIASVLVLISCSLQSNTIIKPYESFVLGNNQHGRFNVKLTNLSPNAVEVYNAPVGGGKHSFQTVKPNKRLTLKVDKNTALVIDNKSADTANVQLHVTGDVGLSMGYKYGQ